MNFIMDSKSLIVSDTISLSIDLNMEVTVSVMRPGKITDQYKLPAKILKMLVITDYEFPASVVKHKVTNLAYAVNYKELCIIHNQGRKFLLGDKHLCSVNDSTGESVMDIGSGPTFSEFEWEKVTKWIMTFDIILNRNEYVVSINDWAEKNGWTEKMELSE